jgi:hypothetical protein
MADLRPGEPDVVMRHMCQQESDQYRRPGYHGKGNHTAKPVHNPTLSRRLTIVQRRLYASSEYDDVGTCASIACSSATIFGLRSQT